MGEEVIKVLKHLGDQFGVAIDWSSANIMPYLNDLMSRMVKYGIYINIYYIFHAIFCIAFLIVVSVILYKISCKMIIKSDKDKDYNGLAEGLTIAFTVSLAATVVTAVVGIAYISNHIATIIELNTVPEKYVIEMIQDKINDSKTD